MASYIEQFPSTTDWLNGLVRMGKYPLDRSSMFASLADAELYAKGGEDSRGLGGSSYIGQIISVYENDSVKVYKINADRTLSELAAASEAQGNVDTEKKAREAADKKIAKEAGLNPDTFAYVKSDNELISSATSIHNATELIATQVNTNTSNIAEVTATANANHDAIAAAKFTEVGEAGRFIQKAKQENGKVTVTLEDFDTNITSGSTIAPTSKAVHTAIENAKTAVVSELNFNSNSGAGQFIQSTSQVNGKLNANAVSFADEVTSDGVIAPKSSAVHAAIKTAKEAAKTTLTEKTKDNHLTVAATSAKDGHVNYEISLTDVASAQALADEITNREQAITNLTATVTGNKTAINNEVTYRRAIIGQGDVDAYVANTGGTVTYIKDAKSLNDADLKLDAQAKVNADAIAAETKRATKAEGDNKGLIEGVRTDLGATGDTAEKATAFGRIKNLETAVGGTSVADQITSAIKDLSVTDTAENGKYVSSVSESNGKVSVDRRDLVKSGDKVLSIDGANGIQSTIALKKITGSTLPANIKERYQLVGIDNDVALGDVIDIAKDRSLQSAELVEEKPGEGGQTTKGQFLKLTYNVDAATGTGEEVVYVDMSLLLSQAEFKNGLTVNDAGEVSVKLASDTEGFLSIVTGNTAGSGIKLSGVQAAINAAKTAATTEVKHADKDKHIEVSKTTSTGGHDVYTITSKDVASATDLTNLSNNTINGHALSTETITLNGSEINVKAGESVSIETAIDTLTQKDSSIDGEIAAIKAYTVNTKKISGNPVLDGRDIKLDGYTIATVDADVATGDTINVALGKLAKKADDNKKAAAAASTAIQGLNAENKGGDALYIKTISQAKGVISATTGTFSAETKESTSTDTHVKVSVAQSEGNVTGVTVTTNDIASATDLSTETGRINNILDWEINGSPIKSGNVTLDGSNLKLTDYSKGEDASAVAPGDTINAAFSKVQTQIEASNASITANSFTSSDTIEIATVGDGKQANLKISAESAIDPQGHHMLQPKADGLWLSDTWDCGTYTTGA